LPDNTKDSLLRTSLFAGLVEGMVFRASWLKHSESKDVGTETTKIVIYRRFSLEDSPS
jgi:hypothetical protein